MGGAVTSASAARLRVWLFVAVCVAAAGTWIVLAQLVTLPSHYSGGWLVIFSVVPAAAVTALLLARRPGHVVGRLLTVYVLANLLQIAAGAAETAWRPDNPVAADVAGVLSAVAWFGTIPLLAVLVTVFPDLPNGGIRLWAVRAQLAVIAYGAVVAAISWPDSESVLNVTARPLFALVLLAGVVAAVGIFRRWRRASGEEREQLDTFAWAAILTAGMYAVTLPLLLLDIRPPGVETVMFGLVTGGMPAAVAFAVVRRRLYGIDVVVNRVLLWASVSIVLVVLYLGVASAVTRITGGLLGTLLPALVVAGALAPLRGLLQRAVDRVMYGDRQEPHRALRNLGGRLAGSVAADDVPGLIVEAVREAVRSPFVRLELEADGSGFETAAQRGQSTGAPPASVDLWAGNELVGRLLVEPRPGESTLPDRELALLSDLGRQASVAVVAARATTEVLRSRDRLVRAREAERDRLRRDLHDGLSPSLAGIAMMVDACRVQLSSDQAEVAAMLERIAGETQASSEAVRRLLADLRPAALDEIGLVASLNERAEHLSSVSGVSISVEVDAALPVLPPAVELAAYRIAVEAMANAVRHSEARACTVELSADDGLRVVVTDDGVGISPSARENGGLASIRERSLDVGGQALVELAPQGGTRVVARLPLIGPAGR